MTHPLSPARMLRDRLAAAPYLFASGVFTPIEARIAELVGLELVFVSGYSCSLGYLCRADLGFVTLSEMVDWSRAIARATGIPAIADADDGYGNPLQVVRTVEEFERAGIAGISIEDQRAPKRCGHIEGRECLPPKEAAMKIRAAASARNDSDFVIIARTDAIGIEGEGLASAIERGKRYADEGADVVWAEFPSPDRSLAERFAAEVRAFHPTLPLFFNYSSSFDWTSVPDAMSFQELGQMGYRLIVVGLGAIHAAMHAEWEFLADLKANEEQAALRLQRMLKGHPTESHHRMGGLAELLALGKRYSVPS